MNTAARLPDEFAMLEPFVANWALENSAERAARRTGSTPAERQAFFSAAAPLLDSALDYLDARSLASLDAADERLMQLFLSLAHVALADEI